MNKKLIIIIVVFGLLSFAGTFVLAWLTKPSSASSTTPEAVQPTSSAEEPVIRPPESQIPATGSAGTGRGKTRTVMTEKQLENLVYEMREKIQSYDSRLEELKFYEQRLEVVRDTLKEDIEQLNNLRIELARTVVDLKHEQDKLLKSRVEIAKSEKNNLVSIAATYDKMNPEAASKILTNMSQVQNDDVDDAVKILHYMTERTRAKLLAQLAGSQPKVAADFCKRLKQIIEKD